MNIGTDPIPDERVMCHHTGFEKSCRDMVVNKHCPLWMHIAGANPNTGEPINGYACADAISPLLIIENSQQQRQTGAAIESFRNEMVQLNEQASMALPNGALNGN